MALATTTPAAIPEFHLGDRLAKALDFAGMKNHDMAEILDVGRNTVGNYTSGRTKPSRSTIMVWAQATGVALDWLVGDDYCASCGHPAHDPRSRCSSGFPSVGDLSDGLDAIGHTTRQIPGQRRMALAA